MTLPRWAAIACVCCASIIWGAAYSVNKLCLNYGSPLQILLIQLTASVLFLLLTCLLLGTDWKDYRSAARMWWTGLLEPGATYLFGMLGLRHSNASIASIIISSEAIFAMIIIAALGWGSLSRSFIIIALLSSVGMYMAVTVEAGRIDNGSTLSYLYLLLSTLCAAAYLVMSARVIGSSKPLVVAFIQQLVALIALFVVYMMTGFHTQGGDWNSIPDATMIWIAVSGIAQYALAFSLFLFALSFIDAAWLSIYLNLTPIFGVTIAALALGEVLHNLQIVGCAIAIGALFLLSLDKAPHRARS